MTAQIVIADDEIVVAMHLQELVTSMGYTVTGIAASGKEAVELAARSNPDLILMDIVMPGKMDGIAAAARIKAEQNIPIIFITAYTDSDLIEKAKDSEPFAYIMKPFQTGQLHAAIEIALYKNQIEQRLRISDETAHALLNATSDNAILIDADLTIQALNLPAARLMGQAVDQLTGARLFGGGATPWLENGEACVLEVLQTGKPVRFLSVQQDAYYDNCYYPIYGSRGKTERVAIFSRDITTQKLAEKTLQNSHEQLEHEVEVRTRALRQAYERLQHEINARNELERARLEIESKYINLIETMREGFGILDQDFNIVYANQGMCAMHGYTLEELVGRPVSDFVVTNNKTLLIEQLASRKGGRSDSYELAWQSKDGRQIPTLVCPNPIFDKDGNFKGTTALLINISARKQAEEALKDREKQLRIKTSNLEEAKVALEVLLKKRDEDRIAMEQSILTNVKELIMPYLAKLNKTSPGANQKAFIDIIDAHLNEIISPFSRNLSLKYFKLTPTEIQVANLIKHGHRTKKIAEIMSISPRTVDTHRKNIRKKLILDQRNSNLRSFLLSLN